MRIRVNQVKVSLAFGIVALIAYGVAAWGALHGTAEMANSRLRVTLETTLSNQVENLKGYKKMVQKELKIITEIGLVQEAVGAFTEAFYALGSDPSAELQRLYIKENPHGAGSRDNLLKARDGSDYSLLHAAYHGWFKNIIATHDLYDLFLINAKGDILYTVFKENDLGTNLQRGAFNSSPLAKVVAKAMNSAPGIITTTDFARYKPSKDIPASFMAIPIYRAGAVVGVLAIQLRLDPLIRIMKSSRGLDETAESYLVNQDKLMVSDSRFVENVLLRQKVATNTVERALSGAAGFQVTNDYRGKPVLSAYRPFRWAGVNWAGVAEMDVANVDVLIAPIRNLLLWSGLLVVLLSAAFGWAAAARD